ncbi:MAG: hypothetical protein ACLTQI_05010 [Slackia sp.]
MSSMAVSDTSTLDAASQRQALHRRHPFNIIRKTHQSLANGGIARSFSSPCSWGIIIAARPQG